jgi:hypothetical protein
MAATYTEVTLPEMETFLKRGFRALRPKQGLYKGEICFDLLVSPTVSIKVLTSIRRSGAPTGVGEDAIRVMFWGVKVDRTLVAGKAPIVKRTQNWRNSLQDKIEDYLELYEEKSDYWDVRGAQAPGSNGPPCTEKQVNFILGMASRASEDLWESTELSWPPDREEVARLTSKEASKVIEILLAAGLGRRYATVAITELPSFEVVTASTIGELASQLESDLRGNKDAHDIVVGEEEALYRAHVQAVLKYSCEGGCEGDCDKTEGKCEGTCGGTCDCKKAEAETYSYDFTEPV